MSNQIICEEILKTTGLKCTYKAKLIRDGKNVCGIHKKSTTKTNDTQVQLENEQKEIPTQNKLKMVDLFAGTGAFSLAFKQTGMVDIVFSNDMDKNSETIYNLNLNHKLYLGNLNDIDNTIIPSHDILTAGFPCQPFSIAGYQAGFQDERSNVFWKILSIIDHHKPACVVLENVKNLVSHDNGTTFKTITENLESRGYSICFKVLNTSKITGIPQNRERIYIVCFRSIITEFNLDFELKQKKKISEFLETDIPSKYYYTDTSGAWNLLKDINPKIDTVYQYRRVYIRENKSNECPTLTANMGTGGHNVPIIGDKKGIRKLMPRECFNLQGFPSTYLLPQKLADSHLYKLVGNAVSFPIASMIAVRLVPLLLNKRG